MQQLDQGCLHQGGALKPKVEISKLNQQNLVSLCISLPQKMIPSLKNEFQAPASAFENWPQNTKNAHFGRFPTFSLLLVWSPNYSSLSLQLNSKVVKHKRQAKFATKTNSLSVFVQKLGTAQRQPSSQLRNGRRQPMENFANLALFNTYPQTIRLEHYDVH